MNNDYISRQWLLDKYDKRHKGPPGGARKMIEEAPAADVRPVPKGQWVSVDAETEKCSHCKRRYYISALFAVGGNNEPDFCPGCGAYMGGDACAE